MNIGTYISGAGHLLLILWVLLTGLFSAPRPEPMEVTDVTILSGEEFAALTAPAAAPQAAQKVEAPEAPAMPSSVRPAPAPDKRPAPPAPPQPQTADQPDEAPDTSGLPTAPEANVAESVPAPVPPTVPEAPETPVADSAPPRPSQRVAPEAAPPSPEDVAIADIARQAARADEAAETPAPEREDAAAPEEAARQTVTEAEERPETGLAMSSSPMPRARPARHVAPPLENDPAPEKTAETAPEKTPETAPAESAEEVRDDAISDAVADAVAAAMSQEARPGTGTAASGPPLTAGERDALRVSVSKCWNVGSLSTEALMTSVVVGVDMAKDGRPQTDTIRLISWSGGSEGAARQTYESARRAILRCGASGFALPAEKYGQWREIEMTFNPENMRIR